MRFTARTSRAAALLAVTAIAVGLQSTSAPAALRLSPLAGEMKVERYAPAVGTLPDGKVLIAGGHDGRGTYPRSAELFNPATDAFEALSATMGTERAGAAHVTLADGDVLIAGGHNEAVAALRSAELFNPATDTFEGVPFQMTTERNGAAATLLSDGKVLIAGGANISETLGSAELFNPGTLRFEALAPGNTMLEEGGRAFESVVALPEGGALVAGGVSAKSGFLRTAEVFRPPAGPFESLPSLLHEPREEAASVLLQDGEVLLAGGYNEGASSALDGSEVLSPATKLFTGGPEAAAARKGAGAALLSDGVVLIVGGEDHLGPLTSAEEALPSPPSVSTGGASGITAAGATLASIVSSETVGSVYFQYGTSSAYGGTTVREPFSASLAPGVVTATAGALAPATRYHFRAVAENAGGTAYGSDQVLTTAAAAPLARTVTIPQISGAHESASRWREGGRPASISTARRLPVGTTLSLTLQPAATLHLVFTASRAQRQCARRGGSHARPRCSSRRPAGTLALAGHAGRDRIRFDGRLAHSRRLTPGRYTVTITARDSAGSSRPVSLGFTIVG